MRQEITELLHELVDRELLEKVGYEGDLIESGVLDSITIAQLIVMLEEKYNTRIGDDDFEVGNFRTIQGLEQMVFGLIEKNTSAQ